MCSPRGVSSGPGSGCRQAGIERAGRSGVTCRANSVRRDQRYGGEQGTGDGDAAGTGVVGEQESGGCSDRAAEGRGEPVEAQCSSEPVMVDGFFDPGGAGVKPLVVV